MYVEKLHLQNIKCFEDIEFSFLKEDGSSAKWITLLGENATGKTTVLQSIVIPIAGFFELQTLLPRPEYWVRNELIFGKIHIGTSTSVYPQWHSDYLVVGSKPLLSSTKKDNSGKFITYSSPRFIAESHSSKTKLEDGIIISMENMLSGESSVDFGNLACAYGAFRRLSRGEALPQAEMPKQGRFANYITLFHEDPPLTTFNQWIASLDYQSAKGDTASRKKLLQGIKSLNELLPDGVTFDLKSLDEGGKIRFLVQNRSVPTPSLSDGYRSILALGGDLIWRLLNAYPDSLDPTAESGVVLIDELDIHLHPRWQAWIAQKLRSAFPNIQFIVATHSPLVAMGAYWNGETGELRDDVLTLKLEINDGKASVQRIDDDLAAMDINRALESPAFGMVAPRPPEVEAKIDRYDDLLEKESRTKAEETELQKLQHFMAEVRPIGGKPAPGSFEAKLEDYLREKLG